MENKWEYDYSGLYQNGYNPAPPTGSGPSGQMPGDGGMPGAPMGGGEPPRKKRGIGKKVLAGVLALVLVEREHIFINLRSFLQNTSA